MSRWSVAETLTHIAPDVPAALVTPAARAAALAVAAQLPAALTRWMYLECRLATGVDETDLIVSVDAASREILASSGTPPWPRLRTFAKHWSRPSSPLHGLAEELWLEFDVAAAASAETIAAAPGFFVHLSDAARFASTVGQRLDDVLTVVRAVRTADSGAMTGTLARCLDALPPGASILYVGGFPHRPDAAHLVRICVTGLTDDALVHYLRRIGWPGSFAHVHELLRPFRGLSAYPGHAVSMMHLDIGDGVYPGVSFEMEFSRECQRAGRIAELALLDALVREGLCDAAKRDGILAWPTRSVSMLPHELWRSVTARRINHVKLCWRPDRAPIAKAYLALAYRSQRTLAERALHEIEA